jgi:hypothetical protein
MRRTLLQTMVTTALSFLAVSQSRAEYSPDQNAVLKVDETLRVAKLANDTATLNHLVAKNYVGVNQFGEARNKQDFVELFKTLSLKSFTTKPSEVRITGDTAVVTGTQTEENPGGVNRMLFMRIYVRNREAGEWQLVANMQSIRPD